MQVDLNIKNKEGVTPLVYALERKQMEAAEQSKMKAARSLIEAGADVNIVNEYGQTPLMLAIELSFVNEAADQKQKMEIIELILKKAPQTVNKQSQKSKTALHFAAKHGYSEVIKCLCRHNADKEVMSNREKTPLHVAKDGATVQLLIDLGAEKDKFYGFPGITPLMFFARIIGKEEHMSMLIKKGADIHKKNKIGSTALHYAAYKNNARALEMLIQNNADIHATNSFGSTPLALATMMECTEVMKYLIAAGAKINDPDTKGNSPLILSIMHCNCITKTIKLLLSKGAATEHKNNKGETALHVAVINNNVVAVRLLVEAGADMHAQDNQGQTPLTLAAKDESSKIHTILMAANNLTKPQDQT